MSKEFNTAGPSVAGENYMIDPRQRIDLSQMQSLIADRRYFVLHASRRTGKTTSLLALMQHLRTEGRYRACYANIEGAQTAGNDVVRGIRAVCGAIARAANAYLGESRLHSWIEESWAASGPDGALTALLARWSRDSQQPIVLMLDEVDALVGDTLIALLRQIRAGYAQRPRLFPQTVILCGVRDIKDYRIRTSYQEIITGGSVFNISAESLRLGNFSRDETEALWRQHEEDTGQQIDPAIWPELWEDTAGQPWLVNALGYELTSEDHELHDRSKPITLEHYWAARERIIQTHATELDHLADKLSEERVRRVIDDIMADKPSATQYPPDDLRYVEDLGLIVRHGELRIANRIYREIIPRELTVPIQAKLSFDPAWYIRPDRRLDLPKLLTAFQEFFRQNSDRWLPEIKLPESAAQLLVQAFLHRLVNGGGRIEREYSAGRGRMDLKVAWPVDEPRAVHGPIQKAVVELKMLRRAPEATLAKALKQTTTYADANGADEAYILLFDRRPGRSWEERIWQRQEKGEHGRAISVWGM